MEKFNFEKSGVAFAVEVTCLDSNDRFQDNWTLTDEAEDGVTIVNREGQDNTRSYPYAIPRHNSLKELADAYASQGSENALEDARESLEKELVRDLYAMDYGFIVSASIDGAEILKEAEISFAFNYSYHDEATREEVAKLAFFENGVDLEAWDLVKARAKEIIAHSEKLSSIVAE